MKFIFDVYNEYTKGIIEILAKDDQDAINKVAELGLKFSSMRPDICVYHIQYAMKDTKLWRTGLWTEKRLRRYNILKIT